MNKEVMSVDLSCFSRNHSRKKGGEKYYIIMSMILGLIVLSLSLYFIFQEYFDEDEIDWQTCRQSILLRNSMPESKRATTASIEKIKESFPLKCKTEVVDLELPKVFVNEEEEYAKIRKVVADSMAECFSLFGEGAYKLFPVNHVQERKDCVICKRIHFTGDTRPFKLDMKNYLSFYDVNGKALPYGGYDTDKSYWHYLVYHPYDSLVFATNDNYESGEWGVRPTIDASKGDLLIGMYFYSNPEFNFFGENIKYQWSNVFYAQSGVDGDELSSCAFSGIPA